MDRLRRERDRLAALRERAAETNREILNVKAKLDTTREKHRETTGLLRELDDLDTLYRNTQLLVAFDKLHEIKRQTNDVSSRLLEMKRENSHTGFIPDQEYLTELGVNRQLYAEARHACRQAEEDLHEVERAEVIGADVQRNLQYTLKHGGEKNVLRETALLHNRTAWAGVFALLLAFLIVGAAVVAGVWLPPMYRAGGFDAILVYVLVFGIGSLLCVGGDVGLWILVRDKAAKERAYYLDFGARNRRELLIRLRNIAEYRSRAADQLMRIRAAHKYCEKTEAVRLAAEQELVKSLGRWGREPDEDADILAYTDQVERSARTYLDTVAMLKEEKSRLDAAASQLRAQLEGQNEAAIRAKVPKNSREKMRGITPEEIAGSIATQKRRAELLSKSEEMLSAKLALLRENAADPASVSEMLCETERALIRAERHLAALEYALSTLYKVDDRLKARIVPRLASHALELIKSMSGGVYRDLSMSDDLSLELKKGNEGFATEMLSAGTRDIAYMALRIAMIFMVCREEKPPLCLDECFAYQDDNRALEMMKMLKEQADKGIQSLVFTCRAREEILAHQAFGPHIGYTKLEYTA
ncbi:MAG: hypothetical protein J6125_03325 [Clostridia bacterium]|nr:hypothetical protein [Clostridia bacterium]